MNDSNSPKSERHPFRFSLWTLLVVVVVLSVVLGRFALKLRQAERQWQVVKAIGESGRYTITIGTN